MGFRLVPKSVTLNDLERRNGPYFVFFTELVYDVVVKQLEMWANAQGDGLPVEYRWRPLFNAAKFC